MKSRFASKLNEKKKKKKGEIKVVKKSIWEEHRGR